MSEEQKPQEFWDLEKVYDEQISPLMTQILKICKENRLPMVASFAYSNQDPDSPDTDEDKSGLGFCTSFILPNGRPVQNYSKAINAIKPPPEFIAMTITTNKMN